LSRSSFEFTVIENCHRQHQSSSSTVSIDYRLHQASPSIIIVDQQHLPSSLVATVNRHQDHRPSTAIEDRHPSSVVKIVSVARVWTSSTVCKMSSRLVMGFLTFRQQS